MTVGVFGAVCFALGAMMVIDIAFVIWFGVMMAKNRKRKGMKTTKRPFREGMSMVQVAIIAKRSGRKPTGIEVTTADGVFPVWFDGREQDGAAVLAAHAAKDKARKLRQFYIDCTVTMERLGKSAYMVTGVEVV